MPSTIRVNMRQMRKWQVTQDNVMWYDAIMRMKGVVETLDGRSYTQWLREFNIFYTEVKHA